MVRFETIYLHCKGAGAFTQDGGLRKAAAALALLAGCTVVKKEYVISRIFKSQTKWLNTEMYGPILEEAYMVGMYFRVKGQPFVLQKTSS